jgi:hypothetical protein
VVRFTVASAPQGFPSFLRGWCVQAGRPQSTEGDPVSIRVVAWVLEMSEARLGARLVLLALASHAREDGSNAFPSQATIAAEARLTDRQVRRCIKNLERDGAIARTGITAEGVVIWRVNMSADKLSPPDIHDSYPGQIVQKNGRKCPTNRKNRSNRQREDSPDYDAGIIKS